jgi:ATP-dependent DNA ligase
MSMKIAMPLAFIEPCLPMPSAHVPEGAMWVHEIKHDGYRLIVRRDGEGVRLFTRRGHDWTVKYPQIVPTCFSGSSVESVGGVGLR